MILLIFSTFNSRESHARSFKFHCDSINMHTIQIHWLLSFSFKFHCDSINILSLYRKHESRSQFKFHCDSINIDMTDEEVATLEHLNSTVILLILSHLEVLLFNFKDLNSTVILLIWFMTALLYRLYADLNSTVILLICRLLHAWSIWPYPFKFHCDSINMLNNQQMYL